MPTRITVDLSQVRRQLGILEDTLLHGLAQGIAEGLFALARESFEKETSPEGQRWAPLSPRYSIIKQKLFPGRPILQATRSLSRSLFRTAQGTRAIVGASAPYAAIHQFGGRAGRKHAAQIPARPYLPSGETAEREAVRLAEEVLNDALRRSEGAA